MSYFNKMLYNIQQDGCWTDVRFKIMRYQNDCFRFPHSLYDIVNEEEYNQIEEKRFPLFISTQFGGYPKPEKHFGGNKEPILVGILSKSQLSGLVYGLKISHYKDGKFTKISFFSNLEIKLNQDKMSTIIRKEPKIEIAKELKEQLATQTETESQVIIHISYCSGIDPTDLRIWNNTYLECKDSGTRSGLLFSENIAIYPNWIRVGSYTSLDFTLIFENLPKGCNKFDLIEDIPEEGGFLFKDIPKNSSNVYYQKLR